jgi:hypothetical protein
MFDVSRSHSGESRNLPDWYYFYHLRAGHYSSEKKWLCKNELL